MKRLMSVTTRSGFGQPEKKGVAARSAMVAAVIFLFFFFLFCQPLTGSAWAGKSRQYRNTVETLERVGCVDEANADYFKGLVAGLSYSNMRLFQAFAQIPALSEDEIEKILQRLVKEHVSFDNLLLFEHFSELDTMTSEAAWLLLDRLAELDYAGQRAITQLVTVEQMTVSDLLAIIKRLSGFDPAGKWAFKAFLEIETQSVKDVYDGLDRFRTMSSKQRWASESLYRIPEITTDQALSAMGLIRTLNDGDAWIVKALFSQPEMSGEKAAWWLKHYFLLDQQPRERVYRSLPVADKSQLLTAFIDGGDHLIWKINNLHAVTDRRGQEIPQGVLGGASRGRLSEFFSRLDFRTRGRFSKSFTSDLAAGNRGRAVGTLRRATSAARMQAAKDCNTANIYALLSIGSELYDSSFRDILVPVLKDRINGGYRGNLLTFLMAVDPQNKQISDFIISLAQRGKLTVFFPQSSEEQRRILDLVADSAFQDEKSLILFSATFVKLLKTIQPETRSYLISIMLSAIRDNNTTFTKQLRVILQYYFQEYPELVGRNDKARISKMMEVYGAIPLEFYTRTAFGEWKRDSRLSSLSVFHDDDDGHQSYRSNCMTLFNSGYRPRLSRSFHLLAKNSSANSSAKHLIQAIKGAPTANINRLYSLQKRQPVVVDWVKIISGVEVSHSVFVYSDEPTQKQLFEQFLKGGHEMFAQRGHSYWRKEQLIAPLKELLEEEKISGRDLAAKQRFMSIGSCGGVRAYSELALLFNNHVDILATVGTGKAVVNDPYNKLLFELVATGSSKMSWEDISRRAAGIFKRGLGEDYLQPGSLPAILHKIMDQKEMDNGTDQT
ncbi:MAG: hypothetical protein ABFS19_12940 [Thermodesulfobacteriota bacterium]